MSTATPQKATNSNPPKLIEIHMIQNHSPSNMNRDDLGAPKTCMFGGTLRARISSQCLKRSIRRSVEFAASLERDCGVRTRRLITVLAERVHGTDDPPRSLIDFIAKVFEKGGVKRTGKGEEPDNTNILLFVPNSTISEMIDAIKSQPDRSEEAQQALAQRFAAILGRAACVPDIALSGRMTELDRDGLFAKLDLGVEGALSAAHAISTHEVINEVDYFTAADDKAKRTGAGHVDEAQFNSACFYKYFCLDWDQLLRNLTPPDATEQVKEERRRLAAATLGHFLRAAALTTPSGKQNSHAARNEPAGILVEIKKNGKTPTSYANAFAEPARRIGTPPDDSPDEVSLIGRSIAQLGDHVHSIRRAFGIDSKLLWYSPALWRYPLRGWERGSDGRKANPATLSADSFDVLGGEVGKPTGLVDAVLTESGFNWPDVRDAGKSSPDPSRDSAAEDPT